MIPISGMWRMSSNDAGDFIFSYGLRSLFYDHIIFITFKIFSGQSTLIMYPLSDVISAMLCCLIVILSSDSAVVKEVRMEFFTIYN